MKKPGGMTITLPKVGVGLTMKGGMVGLSCREKVSLPSE